MSARPALLLAVALAACGPRAPEGGVAVALPEGSHSFAHDAAGRRVLFVVGGYPNKTYLGSLDLGTGRLASRRAPALSPASLPVPGRDGRVLLIATPGLDPMDAESPATRLSEFDWSAAKPGSGAELREGHVPLCLTGPAGGGDASVVTLAAGREPMLSVWKDDRLTEVDDASLPEAEGCRFAASVPRLLLMGKDSGRQITVFDFARRAEASVIRPGGTSRLVGGAGGDVAYVQVTPSRGDEKPLLRVDLRDGSSEVVLRSTRTARSAVETPGGVFVLLGERAKASSSVAAHFQRQELVKLGAVRGGERSVEWRAPWSVLPGELLGWDESRKALVVATNDTLHPSLWAVPAVPAAVAATRDELDKAAGPLRRRAGTAALVLGFAAFVMVLIFGIVWGGRR